MIPGGYSNFVSGSYSLAAGQQARAIHSGTFVWSDSSGGAFPSAANNEFAVRAAGGVRFVTSGAGLTVDGQSVLAGGNGGGLTNVNAATLSGLSPGELRQLAPNVGAGQFLGSTNNQPVDTGSTIFAASASNSLLTAPPSSVVHGQRRGWHRRYQYLRRRHRRRRRSSRKSGYHCYAVCPAVRNIAAIPIRPSISARRQSVAVATI